MIEPARRAFSLLLHVGGVERPASFRRVELPLRARRDALDDLLRDRFAERPVDERLVTGGCEQQIGCGRQEQKRLAYLSQESASSNPSSSSDPLSLTAVKVLEALVMSA